VKKWIAANKGVVKMSLVKSKGKRWSSCFAVFSLKRALLDQDRGVLSTSMDTSSLCRFATHSGHLSLTTKYVACVFCVSSFVAPSTSAVQAQDGVLPSLFTRSDVF
jgi:hypothetical protein